MNFRDSELIRVNDDLAGIWHSGVLEVYKFCDFYIIEKLFPEVSSINLKRKVAQTYWDRLVEDEFNQNLILLVIQIIKVGEEQWYNKTLLRLMNWL